MINFLTGIDVQGNIDLNRNELLEPRIENQSGDPAAGGEGQLYFNTTTDKLMLYANGAWVAMESGGDDNTTYDLSGVGTNNGTAGIRLAGSDGTNDDVLIVGSGTSSVTRSGNTLTVASIEVYQGTVTSVSCSVTGNAYVATVVDGTEAAAITIAPQGAATDYINGLGNLVALSTLPSGSWTLDADVGSPQTISSGDTATFVGSTGIETSIQGLDELTIENTLPFNSLSLAGTTGTPSTIVNSGSITITAGTSMTTVGDGSGGVTVNYTGGTGTMSSFTAKGDGGDDQTISDGNTLYLKGGPHITTTGATTDVVQFDTDATTTPDVSVLMARDGAGFGYVITPNSGDSTTKIATTAFVQASLTGLLEFKSGFAANSGVIADGTGDDLYTDRAISIGDYYVVTVAGNFFGNAATPLTPGDSVIVQDDAAAGSATESDFIVVQSDTDLATASTVGIGNVTGSAAIGVSYTTGTATITNTDKGSSQNIFKNVASDSGTAVADDNDDTLTIVGSGSVSTAVTGDTLTITGTNTTYSMMTSTVLGLGKLEDNNTQTVAANTVSATASRTYGIQKNASNQLVVNVPWVNDDTGITAVTLAIGTGATAPLAKSISGTELTLTSNKYGGTTQVGYVPEGGSASTFLKGNGTWATPTNTTYSQATESVLGIIKLSTDALALAGSDDLTAITPSVLASTTYTNTYPSSTNNTWTIAAGTHNLGNGPFVIQTYDASTGAQVFIKTTAAPSTGVVTMATTSNQSANAIRVVMMKVW